MEGVGQGDGLGKGQREVYYLGGEEDGSGGHDCAHSLQPKRCIHSSHTSSMYRCQLN